MYNCNLDLQAAKAGQAIVSKAKVENKKQVNELQAQLNKSLGVLQESGVYALFMYLLAKRKKDKDKADPCQTIIEQLLETVRNNKTALGLGGNEDPPEKDKGNYSSEVLNWVQGAIVGDLRRLLLVKELFQRALTYARYTAEAREVELELRGSGGKSGASAPKSGGQP